jgi:hypothetical protein
VSQRVIAGILGLCVAAAGSGAARAEADRNAAERPQVLLDRAVLEGGRVSVDYHLEGVFSEETLELVHSGIPVKFRHKIELIGARKFLLSPRNVLARTLIETRVAYDALTGRYELSRVTTLKKPQRKNGPPPYSEGSVTGDREEMRRWMAEGQGVVLYDPKRELDGGDLRVSIESSVGRKFILWVIPARESFSTVGPVER